MFPNICPPLGPLYLAAQAQKSVGAEVRIIDQLGRSLSTEEVIRQARDFGPDVVGLKSLTLDEPHLKALAEAFRQTFPDVLLLAGGPHATCYAGPIMQSMPFDALVRGEGELSFDMILRAHAEGGGLGHIPGLIWRDKTGEIIQNEGTTPVVSDLDTLPMPAYDLIDYEPYWRSKRLSMATKGRYMPLFTSRGCPFRCAYCHSAFGKQFRGHSAERVVEEISLLNKRYGVLEYEVYDDCFNFDRQRVLEFSERVRKTGLRTKFVFANGLRPDILTEEGADALAAAGAYMCMFSLESGSPRIQKMIGKNLDLDRYLATVEMVSKKGMFLYGAAMMGFPTETLEEMRMTIDVACRSKLHAIAFFVVVPFPGTQLYRDVLDTDPSKLDQEALRCGDFLYNHPTNLSPVSDEQLMAVIREANRRFYLNPGRIARIVRDYPSWRHLPYYAWKGMLVLSKRRMMR